MDLKLKNKNALVCGSTQGIGKASAMALAAEGANITLISRNKEKLEQVLSELPGHKNHSYIIADFSNPEELQKQVTKFIEKKHNFHIVINNTGGPRSGNLLTADLNAFNDAFTMHLKCNHLLAQATIPFMKKEGFGRIINVISTSVKEPIPGLGVSNTIRGAVANWSKTLSFEVAEFGITVNNILPGFTKTERLNDIIKIKANAEGKSIEVMTEVMKSYTPIKRFAQPEETAHVIAFLASEAASYVNGINIPVDGGRTKSL